MGAVSTVILLILAVMIVVVLVIVYFMRKNKKYKQPSVTNGTSMVDFGHLNAVYDGKVVLF